MDTFVWRDVISSIEESATLYDEVNEIISLGRASRARTYAAQRLMESSPRLVLDSGAGLGSMSVILLQRDPQVEVVALDHELGKLDSIVKRFFAAIYVRFIMPLIAKIMISGRLQGNPWRMIMPTYQNFPTTRGLLKMLEGRFDLLGKKQFLAGGIIVIRLRARRS